VFDLTNYASYEESTGSPAMGIIYHTRLSLIFHTSLACLRCVNCKLYYEQNGFNCQFTSLLSLGSCCLFMGFELCSRDAPIIGR